MFCYHDCLQFWWCYHPCVESLYSGPFSRYSTGFGVNGGSALIHDFYSREVTNPVHLTVDTGFSNGQASIKAYVSTNLSLGDRPLAAQFQEIPLDLRMVEAERVGCMYFFNVQFSFICLFWSTVLAIPFHVTILHSFYCMLVKDLSLHVMYIYIYILLWYFEIMQLISWRNKQSTNCRMIWREWRPQCTDCYPWLTVSTNTLTVLWWVKERSLLVARVLLLPSYSHFQFPGRQRPCRQ